MSRLARTISESGVYHILFRGVNQQNIFEEAADFNKLKETIDKGTVLSSCLFRQENRPSVHT